MTDFNSELGIIEDFSNSLKGHISIKLSISEYIQENDIFLNKDFFGSIENVNDEYIEGILEKVGEKLIEFKKIKLTLKADTELTKEDKIFLLQILNKSGFELIRLQNSIYLEAEKAGYKLDKKEKNKYLRNINLLGNILNGREFSRNLEEVDLIFNYLFSLYNNYGNKLTQEENQIFINFCNDFGKNIPKKEELDIKKNFNHEILRKRISIENVKEIFDKVLELYGLDGWTSKIGNYTSFGVNKKSKLIKIPKNITNITIKHLLELIDHEIGVHAIRGYNTNKTLRKNYDHYVEAEEGFAKLSKSLLDTKIENIEVEVGKSAVSTFIAENYDGEKTYELLKIYYKLNPEENNTEEQIDAKAKDVMLRKKKFLSLEEKGALRKDVSYYRGEKIVLKKLLDEGDIKGFIKKFYFSKLSLEDLKYVDYFKEKLDIDDDELIYPLWVGKILYRKLIGEKVTLEKLREGDPRFEAIDGISNDVKRQIIEILDMIQENVIQKKD